ncbi:Stp1/IreP family PP2C-type Ser/Thr phosphatase [Cellulosilyticum sp. ST5]|nr:Stp1/IreP family PP2C-type Ser/Thr phosphatase [Cellulosilyticum sp. WCF-2]
MQLVDNYDVGILKSEVNSMQAIGKVDIGRKRVRNEDAIFVSNSPIGILPNLYIVADGMGGHKAGSIASGLAISSFCEYLEAHKHIDIKTREDVTILLKLGIRNANHVIYEKSKQDEAYNGMGTTMTVATVIEDIVYLAHVGDTRLYLMNEGSIFQATTDHSLVQEMLEQGYISENETRAHPQRHIITRAVGTYAKVKIDTVMFDLSKVQYMLLCSDGLTSMLSNEEIHECVRRSSGEAEEIVDSLIEKANAKGGMDNIAVIIVKK